MPVGTADEAIRSRALALDRVQSYLAGKTVKEVILARGTLVIIVVALGPRPGYEVGALQARSWIGATTGDDRSVILGIGTGESVPTLGLWPEMVGNGTRSVRA